MYRRLLAQQRDQVGSMEWNIFVPLHHRWHFNHEPCLVRMVMVIAQPQSNCRLAFNFQTQSLTGACWLRLINFLCRWRKANFNFIIEEFENSKLPVNLNSVGNCLFGSTSLICSINRCCVCFVCIRQPPCLSGR